MLSNYMNNFMDERKSYLRKTIVGPIEYAAADMINYASKAISMSISKKIKDTFGKEFIINEQNGHSAAVKRAIIEQFIMKYDKKFNHHAQFDGASSSHILQEGYFFVPLGKTKNTFMLIVTAMGRDSMFKYMYTGTQRNANDMYIFIGGKNCHKYARELDSIINIFYTTQALGIYTVDRKEPIKDEKYNGPTVSVNYQPLKPRDLSTIFFTHGEMEKIINHIDNFISDFMTYEKHQLMYKTGILMWGRPGTGKTSVVRALATKYNRDIISINVPHIKDIDIEKIGEAVTMDKEREYIILFEDIDMVFLNRESFDATMGDKDVINKLMQFLDGQTSPNNTIFIATTNHKENISPAIMRRGRLDLHVEIQEITEEGVKEFMNAFEVPESHFDAIIKEYRDWFFTEKDPDKDEIDIDEYGDKVYNQSAIQSIILNHIQHKNRNIVVEDSSEELKKAYEEAKKEKEAESDSEKNALFI